MKMSQSATLQAQALYSNPSYGYQASMMANAQQPVHQNSLLLTFANIIHAVQTVMKIPLIIINTLVILYLVILG